MHPSPNISRSTVIGCEAKYELSKKKVSRRNFSEIEVFGEEKGYIRVRRCTCTMYVSGFRPLETAPPKTVLYLIVVGGEQPRRGICLVGLCHQG